MRWGLWIIGLFALAVLAAFGLGGHKGMMTVFWPPYRVDVSLTLAVVLFTALGLLIHLAWRGVNALMRLPQRARRWRFERKLALSQQLAFSALFHALGGRFVRADAMAQQSMDAVNELNQTPKLNPGEQEWLAHLSWLNWWTQGECKQSLRDIAGQEKIIQSWDRALQALPALQRVEVNDATMLLQARWALDAHEPGRALQVLEQLSKGARYRSLTLRLKLKALRALGQPVQAFKVARALAKHGGFSPEASDRLLQSLALASLRECSEANELTARWKSFDVREAHMPVVALTAAEWGTQLGTSSDWVMERLTGVWLPWAAHTLELDQALQDRLCLALIKILELRPPDATWLERTEQAHLAQARHAALQALYGMVCLQHALWGKAQLVLEDVLKRLEAGSIKQCVHLALARLAESRNDPEQALKHWRAAALGVPPI